MSVGGFGNSGNGIVTDGLIFMVDAFNSKSYVSGDTITNDLMTSNLTGGTLVNGVTLNGNVWEFDGTNQYIDFGDFLDMGTDDWTIECWINLPGNNTGNDFFLSKAFASVGNYRYGFGLGGTRQLRTFFVGSPQTGPEGGNILGDTQLNLNTWYQATLTFDRDSVQSIYINGVLESFTDDGGDNVDDDISNWDGQDMQSNHPFRLGCYTASNNTSPTNNAYILMGPVKIYNRLLTSSEMTQNYNALKWRFR